MDIATIKHWLSRANAVPLGFGWYRLHMDDIGKMLQSASEMGTFLQNKKEADDKLDAPTIQAIHALAAQMSISKEEVDMLAKAMKLTYMQAIKDERAACAELVQELQHVYNDKTWTHACDTCAAVIRARDTQVRQ
jgi:light-regulated signal transduction histidine kinase (bacteriophytochrome)